MLVCTDQALFNLLTLYRRTDWADRSHCWPLQLRGQGEERAAVNRLRRPSGTIDCGGQWGQLCTNCFFTSLWQRQQSQAGTHESYICFVGKAPGVNSLWLPRGLCVFLYVTVWLWGTCMEICVILMQTELGLCEMIKNIYIIHKYHEFVLDLTEWIVKNYFTK